MVCFGNEFNMYAFGYRELRHPLLFFPLAIHDGTLRYICCICRLDYTHWLCDDRNWKVLPVKMRGEHVCIDCFVEFFEGKL